MIIYLDNAATTKLSENVLAEMLPFLGVRYGNPSSIYDLGRDSEMAIRESRKNIADTIGAKESQIFFTSGGSESDNWVLKSVFDTQKGSHIITTKIEHPAVLRTCEYLEEFRGARVTYLDVDTDGVISLEQLEHSITKDTILISVMFANNEVGAIEPIKRIGEIAKKHKVLFHTDAVQAYGQVPINVDDLNIDFMSASGHKIHAPKGIGFLYARNKDSLVPLIHGGHQERGMRAGTENVAAIVGFGKAAVEANEKMLDKANHMEEIRDYIIERMLFEIDGISLNGDRWNRLPNNASFCLDGIEGESLVLLLDMNDIYVSSGSACTSGNMDGSYVLKAMGRTEEQAHGALRISLSEFTTMEEAKTAVDTIVKCVNSLKVM